MIHSWTITATDAGARLDVFLTSQLPELTRSAVAKKLKAGAGRVNGKPATVHHFLKAGDAVAFNDETTRAAKKPTPVATPGKPIHLPPLKIVEENDQWLVINKPSGLLVHPDIEHPSGTLVDVLVAHDPKIAKVGEDPSRPGIMHRLDREVSGLMVIAKTQDAFDALKKQFAGHTVEKRYLALVYGEVPQDEGDIRFRIARSKSKARMAARPEHEEVGKAAWTHYTVVKRLTGATLLELTILSGRTHQIRAHLLALGHPVVGDDLYIPKAARARQKFDVPRLMLQAMKLEFDDPTTGERKHFELPPDAAFAPFI